MTTIYTLSLRQVSWCKRHTLPRLCVHTAAWPREAYLDVRRAFMTLQDGAMKGLES